MMHFFVGQIKKYGESNFLLNELFGLEVLYKGKKTKGDFFLHPMIDERLHTVSYFAFDDSLQKERFNKMLKINGVGPKIAYDLSRFDSDILNRALQNSDIKFLQSIPGVGPKLAKRLIVELKSKVSSEDINDLFSDNKTFKDIVKTLKPLGYKVEDIKRLLTKSDMLITDENKQTIIKKLIKDL